MKNVYVTEGKLFLCGSVSFSIKWSDSSYPIRFHENQINKQVSHVWSCFGNIESTKNVSYYYVIEGEIEWFFFSFIPESQGSLKLPLSIMICHFIQVPPPDARRSISPIQFPIVPQLNSATAKLLNLWKHFFFSSSNCKTRIAKNTASEEVTRNWKRNGISSHWLSLQSKLVPAQCFERHPF